MSLFIPDPRDQQRPGRHGYDAFDVTVASPELPSGASWLASCLLELGVPLWKPWGIDDRESWLRAGGGRWRYRFPGSGWSRLVPGLVDGRCFRFRRQPVPRFTHAFPGQLPLDSRLVLFVRDPRDALHSEWRRRQRSGQPSSLQGFLQRPLDGWQLQRAVYLACFLGAWLAVASHRPTLLVRFEDSKRSPERTLRDVLAFLGMTVPARARARALAASEQQHVAEAERRLIDSGTVATPLLGTGLPAVPEGGIEVPPALARVARQYGYDLPSDAGSAPDAPWPGTTTLQALQARLMRSAADPALLEYSLARAVSPC
jgi:hypothetical protein